MKTLKDYKEVGWLYKYVHEFGYGALFNPDGMIVYHDIYMTATDEELVKRIEIFYKHQA